MFPHAQESASPPVIPSRTLWRLGATRLHHLLHFHFQICGEPTCASITTHRRARRALRDLRQVYSHPSRSTVPEVFSPVPGHREGPVLRHRGQRQDGSSRKRSDAAAIASAVAPKSTAAHSARVARRRPPHLHPFLPAPPQRGCGPFAPCGGRAREWKTSLVFSTRNIPGALFRP